MGKKQRRKQQSTRAARQPSMTAQARPLAETPTPVEPRRPAMAATPPVRSRPGATWDEFKDRYRHVNAELRQIGILAGSFLVVLLVLAAVLR